MQVEEPIDAPDGAQQSSWTLAITMLRGILEGDTYDAVASRHGITRTAVERRIKAVSMHVASTAGIAGLNAEGAAFVRRLRLHREAIRNALDELGSEPPAHARHIRVLTDEEITSGALRIRGRSHQPHEDLALYYILLALKFATISMPTAVCAESHASGLMSPSLGGNVRFSSVAYGLRKP